MWPNRGELGIVVALLASCGQPLPAKHTPTLTTSPPSVVASAVGRSDATAPAAQPVDNLAAQVGSDDPVVKKRALARTAISQLEAGDLDSAVESFAGAAAIYPEIRSFLLLEKMEIEKRLDRFADAAATANEIISIEPATTATTLSQIDLPGLLLLAGDQEGAQATLTFAKKVAIGELTEPHLFTLADTLAKKGLRDEATAIRMRLLTEYPRGRFTETVWSRLASMPRAKSPLWKLDFGKTLDLAERLGRVNRNPQALEAIALAKKRFPSRAKDASLRWLEASSLFRLRRYDEVIRLRPRTGDVRYASLQRLRAHACWRSGHDKEFIQILESLIRGAPASSEAHTARILLGKYYLTDGHDAARAARYLEQAIAAGAAGNDGENLWTLAWIRISVGEDDRALGDLARYLSKYPDADYTSNALFWTAKLLEKKNDVEGRDSSLRRLIDRYPYNYYSYRARQILGLPLSPPGSFEDRETFRALMGRGDGERDPRLAIIDELDAVGLEDAATEQFRRIVGESPEPNLAYELADRYCRTGSPLLGIRLLSRNFGDVIRRGASGVPDRFWEILFPLAWWPDMVRHSTSSGVDPYLVAAIIRQESGFNPAAVSGAGAVGLMQIMPREIERIARAGAFQGRFSREDLFDPATNLQFGTVELSQKLRLMDDHLVAALAAYNAGEQPVRKWLREIPRDDNDFFIESIPYSETRLYVKSIIRNRLEYARVYGAQEITMSAPATPRVPSR